MADVLRPSQIREMRGALDTFTRLLENKPEYEGLLDAFKVAADELGEVADATGSPIDRGDDTIVADRARRPEDQQPAKPAEKDPFEQARESLIARLREANQDSEQNADLSATHAA